MADRLGNINPSWLKKLAEEDIPRLPFERYYYISTLFLLVRLISWIEVCRLEQTYLDFSSTKETRKFNAYLNLIYAALSSPGFTGKNREPTERDHWIVFHHLSGIGQATMQRDQSGSLRCMTFQEFCTAYREGQNSEFSAWMNIAERIFDDLKSDPMDLRWKRIQILWFCLDRFLDYVDPAELRTTRDRSKSHAIPEDLKVITLERAKNLGITLA